MSVPRLDWRQDGQDERLEDGSAAAAHGPERSLRVLLVDDEEDAYVLTRDAFEEAGAPRAHLEWIADPELAEPAMRRDEHDVYLVDYFLGARTGLELLRSVPATDLRAPVILLTGVDDGSIDRDALEAGVAEHLSKSDLDGRSLGRAIRYAVKQRRALWQLGESEARLRALYDESPAIFFTLDGDGSVRRVNDFGARMLGFEPSRFRGVSFENLHRGEDRAGVREFLDAVRADASRAHHHEVRMPRRDGSEMWVRETGRAIPANGHRGEIFLVCEDVTEARELSAKLAFAAGHDPLTGLVNRREFEGRLARALGSAAAGAIHAIGFLDLDRFKIINDTCGHLAGDELLRQIGALLAHSVRSRDTVARLGGDEFAVLLEHCPAVQAEQVAAKLMRVIDEFRFVWERRPFRIGVSFGLVPFGPEATGAAEVLAAADRACYLSKDAGGSRVHVHREPREALDERLSDRQWVEQLEESMARGRLKLAFQPIVAPGADDGRVRGELLLRPTDPAGAPLAPRHFLGAAERYRVCARVDRWVVNAALAWLSGVAGRFCGGGFCTVNLSGQSLDDPELALYVAQKLRESRVRPEEVCFEITETAAVGNLTLARALLDDLHAQGCLIALDDFGSGLSSFAYLKSLPVDYLKIDGMFVRGCAEDPVDFAMVRSINELAHAMGKLTIAEHVESAETLSLLAELGVDLVQGFHTGAPILTERL